MLRGIYPDAAFAHLSDYDCIVQIVFKKLEDYVSFVSDPHHQKIVMPDHENFGDIARTT